MALPKAQIIILRQDGNKTIQCMHTGMSSNLNDCGTQSDLVPLRICGYDLSHYAHERWRKRTSDHSRRDLQSRADESAASLRRLMPEILENADDKLTARMRRLLDFLWQEWKHLQLQIESLGEDLEKIASSDEPCIRLQKIPGVGPLVATAVVSAIGNGAAFKKGGRFPPGWGSYPGNGRPEGRRNYWESVSGGIRICARCSSTGPGR